MTFSINDTETENIGSAQLAVIEIDVTSYDATNGEDVSGSALGLPTDPLIVVAMPDENKWVPQYDKGGQVLRFNGDGGTATSGGEPEEAADTTDIGLVQLLVVYHGL